MDEKNPLEERMARIEGGFEQVAQRLNHLETEVSLLRARMDSQFRWTIGIMVGILIPMWVTIILTILFYAPK